VCKQDPAIQMRYLTTSAEAANATYAAGDAPFAVTSLPLTQKQSSDIALHGRTYGFAPVAASGLVLAYRLFDTQTYRQITTLTLTPDQLAGIFTGQIRSWYDPDILKLNPGVTPPPLIGVVGRGDACEETLTFTRWMWEHARKAWLQGGVAAGYSGPKNPYAAGPTDLLPATDRVALVTGARREASVVRVGEADYTSTATYGMIGYMDASWAAAYQLPTVRIKYPDGTISAATPATIEAALSSMHPDRDGLLQPDVSVVDADRWAMPTVSYMLLPRDAANSPAPPDGKTLRAVRDLLAYATTTAQKDLPDGYVPLTDELKALAANAVASVYDAKPLPTTDPPTGGQAPPPPPPPPQGPAAPTAAPTPVPTPTPTPSPDVVIVAAERAPVSEHVAASRSRLVLPGIGIVAAAAAGAGCFLLWKPAPAPGVSRRRPTVRRSR
jgi:ABC-type phosphate transport system substrate-binding protein